ncbi:hypothetical protein SEA_WEASELS2_35 [Rhodococcus phage Weasels2]|uniref:Uncharacterized protein n=1 Tax=Rhodococcus phage Weasels2 TaxID=1897437 RepID=A0A1I9SA19_9CAUD|nr:hypothetical protein FDH04_gp035 [Rhodococcus phage Weasels2]AOZ63625.1 hypothetical protein SEA_WEASELS2_35 [Rhodococcus phage Weasels2]
MEEQESSLPRPEVLFAQLAVELVKRNEDENAKNDILAAFYYGQAIGLWNSLNQLDKIDPADVVGEDFDEAVIQIYNGYVSSVRLAMAYSGQRVQPTEQQLFEYETLKDLDRLMTTEDLND